MKQNDDADEDDVELNVGAELVTKFDGEAGAISDLPAMSLNLVSFDHLCGYENLANLRLHYTLKQSSLLDASLPFAVEEWAPEQDPSSNRCFPASFEVSILYFEKVLQKCTM